MIGDMDATQAAMQGMGQNNDKVRLLHVRIKSAPQTSEDGAVLNQPTLYINSLRYGVSRQIGTFGHRRVKF